MLLAVVIPASRGSFFADQGRKLWLGVRPRSCLIIVAPLRTGRSSEGLSEAQKNLSFVSAIA